MGENKPLLIVGIDPGTTSAYAILDVDRRILHLHSGRELGASKIIQEVHPFGKVVMVASDRARAPSLVENIATKFGAKVYTPPYDLPVDEKRKLASKSLAQNAHEMDALAAALSAHDSLLPLMGKIQALLKEKSLLSYYQEVLETVLRNDLPIHQAIEVVNEENKPREEKTQVERHSQVVKQDNGHTNGHTRVIESLKKDIKILKEQNRKLVKQGTIPKEGTKSTKKQPVSKQSVIRQRNESLEKEIARLQKILARKDSSISTYQNFIAASSSAIVVKKLEHFGEHEYRNKQGALRIQKGDILWVHNPNVFSIKTLEHMRLMHPVIIYSEEPKQHIRDSTQFIFVPAKEVITQELNGLFALADAKKIAAKTDKIEHLKRMVIEYQEQRR